MASTPIVRQAGLMEKFHITRHFLGLDSCVTCSAQYGNEEKSPLEQPGLFRALHILVETHAALGVRLVGESIQKPAFQRLQTVDLTQIVEYSELDSSHLQSVLEVQFAQQFDTNADLPLWRLVVLRDNTIVFAWHHGIGDGMSGLAFHRALLLALQRTSDTAHGEASANIVTIPTSTTFAPPIEDATNLSPSWGKIIQEIFDLFAPTSWTRAASAWTGNAVPKDFVFKNHVRLLDFSATDMAQFLALCRSRQATLTSAFHIIGNTVLSRMISSTADEVGLGHKTISSFIPISLRNIAGTPDDVFCDHVSALHSYIPINSNFSWDDASHLASELRTQPYKSREEIGMLKFLFGQYEAFFKGKLGTKRQGGYELSNLGRFILGPHGEQDRGWTIGKVTFAQCDAVTGPALKLSVVGSLDGSVRVAVTWGEGAVPSSFAEEFTERFDQEVYNLLRK